MKGGQCGWKLFWKNKNKKQEFGEIIECWIWWWYGQYEWDYEGATECSAD